MEIQYRAKGKFISADEPLSDHCALSECSKKPVDRIMFQATNGIVVPDLCSEHLEWIKQEHAKAKPTKPTVTMKFIATEDDE